MQNISATNVDMDIPMETTAVSMESSEKEYYDEVKKRASSLSAGSTTQLVQPQIDSSTELKVKHARVYATVDTLFSAAQSPLTLQSVVQYQEIDIRATHVSRGSHVNHVIYMFFAHRKWPFVPMLMFHFQQPINQLLRRLRIRRSMSPSYLTPLLKKLSVVVSFTSQE